MRTAYKLRSRASPRARLASARSRRSVAARVGAEDALLHADRLGTQEVLVVALEQCFEILVADRRGVPVLLQDEAHLLGEQAPDDDVVVESERDRVAHQLVLAAARL